MIDPPDGPISRSYCKLCRIRGRQYQNYRFPDYNNEPLQKTPIPYQQEQIWDE